MLDALIADEVTLTETGVAARCDKLVYRVECAQRDAERLAGGEATVLTEVEMSDDTVVLVGFSSEERRRLYRALRAVSGIGRRSALLVLDCGEVIDTLRAVAAKDTSYFRGVPGLGKARIDAVITQLAKRYRGALPNPLPLPVCVWVEARDALAHTHDLRAAERHLRDALERSDRAPGDAAELLALVASGR